MEISYWDVRAGSYGTNGSLVRFSNTREGERRARSYASKYNDGLRDKCGITTEEAGLRSPDYGNRPHEYQKALRAENYRSGMAYVRYVAFEVVSDGEPVNFPEGKP